MIGYFICMAIDEISRMADQYDVSPARVIIWEKEGRRVCAVRGQPVIRANYTHTAHLDFRTKNHDARTGQ